jgi:hypothetical protein
MGDQHSDYLWDPTARPDPDIAALERAVQSHSATARGLSQRLPRMAPPKRRVRAGHIAALLAAAAFATVFIMLEHRLSWPEGASWRVTLSSHAEPSHLSVGQSLETGVGETAAIRAARIGEVTLAPGSSLRLMETRRGEHRVELDRGRMHAKIWAPPGYFGVAVHNARVLDLGCEFDLTAEQGGSGVLSVASGWVAYHRSGIEMLVPAGYASRFSETGVGTPVRADASNELRRAAEVLDTLLERAADDREIQAAADALANAARDDDHFTLLSLLTRHRQLASGSIYARLQTSLTGGTIDEGHRARWLRGDSAAIDEWWRRLPRQPKTWWLNWRDAW